MRRKIIGFLMLILVVAGGIVFVERSVQEGEENRRWSPDSSVYRVVMGGGDEARAADSSGDEIRSSGNAGAPADPPGPQPRTSREEVRDAAEPIGPGGGQEPVEDEPPVVTPLPTPLRPTEFRYLVRKGDILGRIVLDHLGSASKENLKRVSDANGLKNPNDIRPGTTLVIPLEHCERHQADGRETVGDLAKHYYGKADRTAPLRLANPGLAADSLLLIPEGSTVWIPR